MPTNEPKFVAFYDLNHTVKTLQLADYSVASKLQADRTCLAFSDLERLANQIVQQWQNVTHDGNGGIGNTRDEAIADLVNPIRQARQYDRETDERRELYEMEMDLSRDQ